MKRFVKNEKGITLIALIITVIVMLILVAVTINVALNGGLFTKAKNASTQTQRQVDKEHLISLITGTLNNTGDLQITVSNLSKEGWTAEETENEKYLKCTSQKNEVFYVNMDTGEIVNTLPEPNIFVGKYYACGKDGCFLVAVLNEDMSALVMELGECEYEINETTHGLTIIKGDFSIDFTYEIIKNDSDEVENIIASSEMMVLVKTPGVAPNVAGIYKSESDDNLKAQIETTEDGVQYIEIYRDKDGSLDYSETYYCLYNNTGSYYELRTSDGGDLVYKYDGNNTIIEMDEGEEDTTYSKQS